MQSPVTAQQLAYVYLQDQIVSGVLSAGIRLRPESIAQALGISRMPVREAIRQLNAEGYVTIRPNRGAIVTSRTSEEVLELFEMRAVLEGLASRVAAEVSTAEQVDDLEPFLHRLRKLRMNHIAWVERHDEFHDLVCRLSGRLQLCAEIRRLRFAVRPYLRLFLKHNSSPETAGHEHERILEAIRCGDSGRAEAVMRAHVMANAEGIAECLRLARTDQVPHDPEPSGGAPQIRRPSVGSRAKPVAAA